MSVQSQFDVDSSLGRGFFRGGPMYINVLLSCRRSTWTFSLQSSLLVNYIIFQYIKPGVCSYVTNVEILSGEPQVHMYMKVYYDRSMDFVQTSTSIYRSLNPQTCIYIMIHLYRCWILGYTSMLRHLSQQVLVEYLRNPSIRITTLLANY